MATLWWNAGKKRWCTDVMVAGKRRRLYFSDERQEAEREYHREMLRLGRPGRRLTAVTVDDLCNEYLEHASTTLMPATHKTAVWSLGQFAAMFHGQLAADIGPAEWESFKTSLHGVHKPNSINIVLSTVKRLYNWAVEMEYFDDHRLRRVRKVPPAERRVRWFTAADVARLLAACRDLERPFVVVLLNTGMRVGELAALTWENVDLEGGYVSIVGSKTSRTRSRPRVRRIPINAVVRGALEAMPRTGDRVAGDVSRVAIQCRVRRAIKRAKLDGSAHTLRHTFASHLVQRGENLKVIAELLGHSTTKTTEIYAHLAPEHLRGAVDGLTFS